MLVYRLKSEVLAQVPHRHWVFTIPKRFRGYFRYDRKLLGKLSRAAYETVCDVFKLEVDRDCGVPAMVSAVQTFGGLVHWHPHIHAIVSEGVFTESGKFIHIPDIWRRFEVPDGGKFRAYEYWQERVFNLLIDAGKIDFGVAASMRAWRHSGFSVDNSVRIENGDDGGMQRLVEYIARCPFSLARMITVTDDGQVVYRAIKPKCLPFPATAGNSLLAATPRNFEIYDQLDFLAEVTQHIPNKGEHQIRYYGWYSNKMRGMRDKGKKAIAVAGQNEPDTAFRRKCRMTWATLIKAVYEVDPLKCPNCGGSMKVVAFIEQKSAVEKILKHCGLWNLPQIRPPPGKSPVPLPAPAEAVLDFSFFESNCV